MSDPATSDWEQVVGEDLDGLMTLEEDEPGKPDTMTWPQWWAFLMEGEEDV